MPKPQPIETAPRDGTRILAWSGGVWMAVHWSGWGGGIWQCSSTGANLYAQSPYLKWWLPQPPKPEGTDNGL